MYQHRNDVYDDVHGEQFLFAGPVTGIAAATTKHGKIFFARSEEGQMVCLYADRYSAPVNLPDGFPLVLSADWLTTRDEVAIGTPVHAICVPVQGKDPRAVRWCSQTEFEACEQRIKEIQVETEERTARTSEEELERLAEIQVARINRQEAELEMQKQLNERLTANPHDYDEAIALGWKVVEGLGNGRQRILERQFPDEENPRRITRHLPPTTGSNRTWLEKKPTG